MSPLLRLISSQNLCIHLFTIQVATYNEDFQSERLDRERAHAQIHSLKEENDSLNQAITLLVSHGLNQAITLLVSHGLNQAITLLVSHGLNQAITLLVSHGLNQAITLLVSHSLNQAITLLVSHGLNQAITLLVSHSLNQAITLLVGHGLNQAITLLVSHSLLSWSSSRVSYFQGLEFLHVVCVVSLGISLLFGVGIDPPRIPQAKENGIRLDTYGLEGHRN